VLLEVKPASLAKAVWDGRIDPPAKGPSGNYLWRLNDIEKASWVMRRRAFDGLPEDEGMLLTVSNIIIRGDQG